MLEGASPAYCTLGMWLLCPSNPPAPSMQRKQLTRSSTPQQRGSVAAARQGCSVDPLYRLHGARLEALLPLRHARGALQPPAAQGSSPGPSCATRITSTSLSADRSPAPRPAPAQLYLCHLHSLSPGPWLDSQRHCRQQQGAVCGKAGTMSSKRVP